MSAGALHSDHINYLILRYLQEKGHESAATAFYTEWRRPPEYRNPENLPFAQVVRRDELISVIQEGLHHDELSARVRGSTQRRFQWTGAPTRDPLDRANGGAIVLENGTTLSRPTSSSAKRKGGRPPILRGPEDFPTPAPKRQRRSEGSEGVQLNGDRDAMEVDAGASPSADADEDGDAVSPAVISPEPEIIEVPERYDSMDVATQTDVKGRTKTSTMYWKIGKPTATIIRSVWNPSSDRKNTQTLLVVGESLCRFYHVPDIMAEVKQVLGVEEPSLALDSAVTACAWHPDGISATCAVDSVRDLPDKAVSQSLLMDYSRDTGSSSKYLELPLLQPPGIVIALKYNYDGRYLLAAHTNETSGLVLVYPGHLGTSDHKAPIAWKLFPHQILDAVWISDDSFVAGGVGSAVHVLTVDRVTVAEPDRIIDSELDTQQVKSQGLKDASSSIGDGKAPQWDKVRASLHSQHVATVCSKTKQMALMTTAKLCPQDESAPADLDTVQVESLPGNVTAIEYQPVVAPAATDDQNAKTSLLAVAMQEGTCAIYEIDGEKESEGASLTCTLNLSHEPALALAWSPKGDYLAVGGTDLVQIWQVDEISTTRQPFVTWRRDVDALRPRNGEHERENSPLSEPSLTWSADGQSLCFAVDTQIAIIRFRPPLESGVPAAVNGHTTP